jgi:hypothetical protein
MPMIRDEPNIAAGVLTNDNWIEYAFKVIKNGSKLGKPLQGAPERAADFLKVRPHPGRAGREQMPRPHRLSATEWRATMANFESD